MPKSKTKGKKGRQDRAQARLEPKIINIADQIEPAVLNTSPPPATVGAHRDAPETAMELTDDLPPLSPMGIEIANRWGKNGLADFERIRRS